MPTWFGVFNLLSPYRDHYVEIEAEDYTQAQMRMRAAFGNDWTSLVPEEIWTRPDYLGHTRPQKFNLKRLELPE